MERLIVAMDVSAAGHLKFARIADRVLNVEHRLVCGPVPYVDDPADYFEALAAMPAVGADSALDNAAVYPEQWADCDRAWRELPSQLAEFSRVELWVDPVPNTQLILVQLLDWLGRRQELVDKLHIVHAETPLGRRSEGDLATLQPHVQPVGTWELTLATRTWRALTASTPEPWRDLLASDLDALPNLRQTVVARLRELPDTQTGLGRTARLLLTQVAAGEVSVLDVLRRYLQVEPPEIYQYWEAGRALEELAGGPQPAIVGLADGPFDLALHDDRARFALYRQSRLSLLPLGHALLAGRADLVRENPRRRWWGGTQLDAQRPWRWDNAQGLLVAPR